MSTCRIITLAVDETAGNNDFFDQLPLTLTRAVPGSHVLDDRVLEGPTDFEWDGEDDSQPRLPLTAEEATALMDDEGRVQVTVLVDKDDYLIAYSRGLYGTMPDHWDLIHDLAFDFGGPSDADTEIVGIGDGGEFAVNYSTDVRTILNNGDVA